MPGKENHHEMAQLEAEKFSNYSKLVHHRYFGMLRVVVTATYLDARMEFID